MITNGVPASAGGVYFLFQGAGRAASTSFGTFPTRLSVGTNGADYTFALNVIRVAFDTSCTAHSRLVYSSFSCFYPPTVRTKYLM